MTFVMPSCISSIGDCPPLSWPPHSQQGNNFIKKALNVDGYFRQEGKFIIEFGCYKRR